MSAIIDNPEALSMEPQFPTFPDSDIITCVLEGMYRTHEIGVALVRVVRDMSKNRCKNVLGFWIRERPLFSKDGHKQDLYEVGWYEKVPNSKVGAKDKKKKKKS